MRVAPWTTPTRYEVAAGPHLVRWKQIPLRHCFRLVSGATPSTTEPEYWDGDIMWVTPDDLGRLGARIIVTSERQITSLGAASIGNRTVPAGSLVLSTRAPIGHLGVAEVSLCTNQGCKSLVPQPDIHVGYAYYQLLARRNELRSLGTGTTFAELSRAQLAAVPFWCPPVGEQRTVADFLDCETDKIDALVAREQRLIELLQEKRTALISHAVTKGLDPDVPMKDSGIEWLGQVPAGWQVMSLSRVTKSRCDGPFGSGLKSDHYVDAGRRVIRLQNIAIGRFDNRDCAFVNEDYYRQDLGEHDVLPGDVLVAGLGDETHPVGRACVAPEGLGDAMVKADCFRFRLDLPKADPHFLALQLSATAPSISVLLSSGATRTRVNMSTMATRAIAMPPHREQRAIVSSVERAETRIDDLTQSVAEAIERLREYRSALITAAVTGQIDVRTYRREAS